MQKLPHRIVWLFGFGYFLAYAPYVTAVKSATRGAAGLFLLPGVIAGTILTLTLLVAMLGWHQHLEGRFSAPTIASGIATAGIIAATTLAYSFDGISILLALLLMRGGVLIVAPVADALAGRQVRWFSRVALGLSLAAIAVVLADVKSYAISIAAIANLAIYLTGYCVRLPMMSRIAKVDDTHVTRRYFTEEILVALAVLAVIAVAVTAMRPQAATLWTSPHLLPSLGIGALYALLYVMGTLIYLDRRENTFCVPLNRGASMLSGITATYLLAAYAGGAYPRTSELVASSMIIGALVLLSPMHHALEVLHETWRLSRTAASRRLPLE
ncbi:MAG TPA: hypothetical protein VEK11_13765 [Thermoanaerobaculia bacterium]|nr:hypothetical protein [Thermoanaerobaculia bacterium]